MANQDSLQTILVQDEPINMTQLIEIPVTQAQQKVPLPDIQQLRSQEGQIIIIQSLHLVTAKVLTNGMTIAGTNAPLAELQKICLVLYSRGWQRGQLIPLLSLNDMADSDATTATTIPYRNQSTRFANWRNVDFPQSFLQYANGTAAANVPYVIMLNCCYLKLDANLQPILGAS